MDQLKQVFPQSDWPFPFLRTNGHVEFKRYEELIQEPVIRSPDPLSYVNANLMRSLVEGKEIPRLCNFWRGPDFLIDDYATWGGSNNDSIILHRLRYIIADSMKASHRFDSVIFLTPPWNGNPPLIAELWLPKKDSDYLPNEVVKSKLALLTKNPSNAFELEQPCVQESFFEEMGVSQYHMRLVRFPRPFEKSFAYGNNAMNLDHPIARALLHLMSIAYSKEDPWKIPASELEAMRHILKRVTNLPGAILSDYSPWADSTNDLWKIVKRVDLASHLGVTTLTPGIGQFVPGSTAQFLDVKVDKSWDTPFGIIVR
jgi:hypothetical protein